LESLGVRLHSRRTPGGVQAESRRSPNGVQEESKRSPNGVQEDLPGVHKESTRSPAGVDKESIRSPQGLWKKTTWFIVDSYHYINNHPTTDYICCKWCNPAPLIGSAPNLVIVENDVNGNPHYKCAFNSQACEQLNIWLGWFQPILNRMTIDNFRWFLDVILFIQTQRVIQQQKDKEKVEENGDEEEDEEGIEVDEDDL